MKLTSLALSLSAVAIVPGIIAIPTPYQDSNAIKARELNVDVKPRAQAQKAKAALLKAIEAKFAKANATEAAGAKGKKAKAQAALLQKAMTKVAAKLNGTTVAGGANKQASDLVGDLDDVEKRDGGDVDNKVDGKAKGARSWMSGELGDAEDTVPARIA